MIPKQITLSSSRNMCMALLKQTGLTEHSIRQNFLPVLRAQSTDTEGRPPGKGQGHHHIITWSFRDSPHQLLNWHLLFPPRVQLILVWVSAAGQDGCNVSVRECESSGAHWFMFTVDPCLTETPCDRLLVGPLQNGRVSHDTHFHNSFGGCQRGGAWMRAGSTS